MTSKFTLTIIAFVLPSTVLSQWSYVVLNPSNFSNSFAFGVGGGRQVGRGDGFGIGTRALLWNGTANPVVDLTPPDTSNPYVYGTTSTHQVGTVQGPDGDVASLWNGSAASWVNLTPAGGGISAAFAIDGSQQVGFVTIGNFAHASLWNGSAATWVDLMPPSGVIHSQAFGIGDGQQVGAIVYSDGPIHASLWTGTGESCVDLHPGGNQPSRANAVKGGQQVGNVGTIGSTSACMWSGSANSYVNLNPTNSYRSDALGVWGGKQVGWADINGIRKAIMWNGSADSYVDLDAILPAEYYNSYARGIWQDGDHTYIIGDAGNSLAGTTYAIMWIGPVERRITGFVNFEGLSDRSNQPNPVTFEFRLPGTITVVGTRSATLGINGEFDIEAPQSGPLDVSAKEGTWLRRTMLIDTSNGSGYGIFDLFNGDCDNDNEVTLVDFAQLSAAFGSIDGDPNWISNADLDRDGEVTLVDFGALAANFGLAGDE